MKLLFILSAFLATGSAQAFQTIECNGNESFGTTNKLKLVLTAVAKTVDEVDEGVKVPYELLLTNDGKVWAKGQVKATQEDVMFQFNGKDAKFGKISGTIYMDELDQSSLSLNGNEYNFDCGSEE